LGEITEMAHGVAVVSHAASIAAFEEPCNTAPGTPHELLRTDIRDNH